MLPTQSTSQHFQRCSDSSDATLANAAEAQYHTLNRGAAEILLGDSEPDSSRSTHSAQVTCIENAVQISVPRRRKAALRRKKEAGESGTAEADDDGEDSEDEICTQVQVFQPFPCRLNIPRARSAGYVQHMTIVVGTSEYLRNFDNRKGEV